MKHPPRRSAGRRPFLIAAGVVLAVLVSIFWQDLVINYHLWRYKASDDSLDFLDPQLCHSRDDARQRLLEVFEDVSPKDDVASFRVAVFRTLHCMRQNQGERKEPERPPLERDVPMDTTMLEAMVRAYVDEADASRRSEMLLFWDELDFRMRFALYGRLANSKYPLFRWAPPMPQKGDRKSAMESAWCETVAPSQVARLNHERFEERWLAAENLTAVPCPDSDRALWSAVVRLDRPSREMQTELRRTSNQTASQIRAKVFMRHNKDTSGLIYVIVSAAYAAGPERQHSLMKAWFESSARDELSCAWLWSLQDHAGRYKALPKGKLMSTWRKSFQTRCGELLPWD